VITIKTKTASVRLPEEMFEEIDEVCDGIGCSRNDWIKDALKDKLREEINDLTNKTDYMEMRPSLPSMSRFFEIKWMINHQTTFNMSHL